MKKTTISKTHPAEEKDQDPYALDTPPTTRNKKKPSFMDELADEAEAEEKELEEKTAAPITNTGLMELADELIHLEEELAELTAQVKEREDRKKQLRNREIPEAMSALGMVNAAGKGSFTFSGGKIHLESRLYASCSEEGRRLLFPFLRKENAGDLIKETVNASTLSAYVRERRGDGLGDPPGVSVHEEVTAKLTKAKK